MVVADLGSYCRQLTSDICSRSLSVDAAVQSPTLSCPTSSHSDYSVVRNNLLQMLIGDGTYTAEAAVAVTTTGSRQQSIVNAVPTLI